MSCTASAGKGNLTTEVTFNPFKEVTEKSVIHPALRQLNTDSTGWPCLYMSNCAASTWYSA